MLNPEFVQFYQNWHRKAQEYPGNDPRSAFDRFFTLWVIYNRLYAEATFELERQGRIKIDPKRSFPDGMAARKYVGQYLGSASLIESLENDALCKDAIESVKTFLAEGRFFIKLHRIRGTRQPTEDKKLLHSLNSGGKSQRAEAVLDFIYSVRINLFHGHKTFEGVQLEVITPANLLLTRIIEMLFDRLTQI